jgi:outer membrane receptor protein involved in Fe transport
MEAGMKGIFRENLSDFSYSSKDPEGQYALDPLLTNKYDNTQNVLSLYNSWQLALRNWGFKGGLRVEQTYMDANFVSTEAAVKQSYTNVFPSLSLTTTLKNKSTLGFGFSQRIKRPSIWELNPYVNRSNPNLERAGNPDLHPVVANNFQVTYNRSKKMSLLLGLSHSFTNNALQYFILFNPTTNVNQLKIGNTGRDRSTGMNICLGYAVTPK